MQESGPEIRLQARQPDQCLFRVPEPVGEDAHASRRHRAEQQSARILHHLHQRRDGNPHGSGSPQDAEHEEHSTDPHRLIG